MKHKSIESQSSTERTVRRLAHYFALTRFRDKTNRNSRGAPVVVVVAASRAAGETDVGDILHVGALSVRELQSRGPALADDVVDLLGDLVVGQRGQVGEGLEEPARQ